MTGEYDLAAAPDLSKADDRYAEERRQYLTGVTNLPENRARALAYRELGYSHSGIARKLDVTEDTVRTWMDAIAERFGREALETRPQSDPVEELT